MVTTSDVADTDRRAGPTESDGEAGSARAADAASTAGDAAQPMAAGDADAVAPAAIDTAAIDTAAIDTEEAKSLWEALIRARSTSPVISAAEDAVFRFYLPLARATARTYAGWVVDPDLAEQAAELGLANAVLAWRRPDICAFAAFARAAMIRQISTATTRGRRPLQPVPAPAVAGEWTMQAPR